MIMTPTRQYWKLAIYRVPHNEAAVVIIQMSNMEHPANDARWRDAHKVDFIFNEFWHFEQTLSPKYILYKKPFVSNNSWSQLETSRNSSPF